MRRFRALQEQPPKCVIDDLNIDSKLFSKLSSKDAALSADDIANIGKYLLQAEDRNADHQLIVAQDRDEFDDAIKKLQQKLSIIFKLNSSSKWTIVCIDNSTNERTAYVMNPYGVAPLDVIESMLPLNVAIRVNDKTTAVTADDYLTLIHLEMMIKGKWKNFESLKVSNSSEVDGLKAKLRKELFGKMYQKVLIDLENPRFVAEFKEFIAELGEFKELSSLATNYMKILESEVENIERPRSDREKAASKAEVERARKAFLESKGVDKLSQMQPKKDEKSDKAAEFQIQKNFPKEMKNFGNFFDILYHTTDDEIVGKILQDIAEKTKVEYATLRQFFAREKQEIDKLGLSTISLKDIAVKNIEEHSEEDVLSFADIVAEMELEDDENEEAVRGTLLSQYDQIVASSKAWKSKDLSDIRRWSEAKKGRLQASEICEAIAVLIRANSLVTGWNTLRHPQVLAVLLYFQRKPNHGILYQILTGEGKTTVVSLLAVIKVLMGEKFVDIVTSNSVLAAEGMKDRRDFYGLFDISVGCNNHDESYVRDMKECYKAVVVYGTIGSFQGDYLRHGFENLNTRGERGFGCIILDEVDSILLDNGGHITKLATPFPGMDSLKYVYINIWRALLKYEQDIPTIFEGKVRARAKELMAEGLNEEDVHAKVREYQQELLASSYDDMKQAIVAANPTKIDIIPPHLRHFADQMLEKWIKSAILAKYQIHENVNYVVKSNKDGEDCIMPVDYDNTGVTLRNTVWSNGMHQFVQLKHNLAVTSETLTSSFISNIGYVKLYRENLLGMTGTLGSKAEYELMSRVYKLNFVKVPPYKAKQLHKEFGHLLSDDAWADTVAVDAFIRAKNTRAVLIICRTIADVFAIKKSIELLKKAEQFVELKIKVYPDDSASHIVSERIGCSEIIIATNIAGRGADFKTTSELEANGGLHVCVTFLPNNQRVQDQAFGRTSRQGKSGTAQIIAKACEIFAYGGDVSDFLHAETFGEIERFRDDVERDRLERVRDSDLPDINFMDALFQKFMEYFSKERGATEYTKPYLKDLKEHWAFWLCKQDYKNVSVTFSVDGEFEKFKAEVAAHKEAFFNPFYYLEEAENLIDDDKFAEAKALLEKALSATPNCTEFTYGAHIKLFEVSIEMGGVIWDRLKTTLSKVAFYGYLVDQEDKREYKKNAVEHLQKAHEGLQKEIDYINGNIMSEGFGIVVQNRLPYGHNEEADGETETVNVMLKHLQSRLCALQTFQQHCKLFQEQIGKMSNVVVQSRIPHYFKDLKPVSQEEQQMKDALLPSELDELRMLGLGVVYSLQQVHDASPAVVGAAQGQILAGLAALALGSAQPYMLPVLGPVAGALISEGICDIVVELISKMGTEYSVVAHIKGKAISYCTALATAGLSALLTSTKVMKFAMKTLKKIADVLRKSPILKDLCVKLAVFLEALATKLHVMIRSTQFARCVAFKSVATFGSVVTSVASETFRDVMFTLVSEKITSKILEETLKNIKPWLKGLCDTKVKEKITSASLERVTVDGLNGILRKLSTESTAQAIGDVAKEIGLGVVRAQKQWYLKAASLAIDSAITTLNVTLGVGNFCDNLSSELAAVKGDKDGNYPIDYKYDMISTHVSEYVYSQVMRIVGRVANAVVIQPAAGALFNLLQSRKKSEEKENVQTAAEIQEVFDGMGLEPSASEAEIVAKLNSIAKDNPEKYEHILKNGYSLLNVYRNKVLCSLPVKESTTGEASKQANSGNIQTLSDNLEAQIVVNEVKDGEVVKSHTFGSDFQEKETIEVNFEPATKDKPGHYTIKSASGDIVIPSGDNSCFYDAVAAVYREKGVNVMPQNLRGIAELPSGANAVYGALEKLSHLLNNPITKNLFVSGQNALLVGGIEIMTIKNGKAKYPGKIKYDEKVLANDVMKVKNGLIVHAEKAAADEKKNKKKNQETFVSQPLPGNQAGAKNKKASKGDETKAQPPPGVSQEKFEKGVANANDKLIGDKGAMIGIAQVHLEGPNGEKEVIKRYALSGESPVHFTDEKMYNLAGYQLAENDFRENKQIYNFDEGKYTDKTFEKACAAVNINLSVAKEINQPKYAGYKIKDFYMAEFYYQKGGVFQRRLNQGTVNKNICDSCSFCKKTLPFTRSKPASGG